MKQQNRARLKLIGIFMLFLGPLMLSYGLYYGLHGLRPGGATNKGQLLTPAEPLPKFQLTGGNGNVTSDEVLRSQWTMLQVAIDGCGDACRKSLRETRDTRALLRDDSSRVQRVLLVVGKRPQFEKQPSLEIYSGMLKPLRQVIKAHDAAQAGTVYLVDPHGNWVLYYPPDQDGMGLYDDIKHLLDLSHIG